MTAIRFRKQRRAFQRLRHALQADGELRAEVELALQKVLRSYPTKIRENRFVVGGVAEVILVAAFRAAGLPASDVGPREARIDIALQGGGGFSVKGHPACASSGNQKPSSIRSPAASSGVGTG